ncbi:MAG TPA: LPS assembly lipoprotein LptE, partial [Tenuifilaceae bacterium]|nr:LPS assembly lipoprotein LptE [Tenuifilaceae bacterium]
LQGIPVTASYSERAIRNSKAVSDANGYVSFSIPMVKSAKAQETFKVDIDVNALLSEATNDFLVRKVIFSIPVNSYTLTVDVVRPSVWIASHETNLGEVSRSNTMENALRKRMVTSGLVVATSRESADFILELQGNTVSKGQTNSFYQVALSLVVKLVKQDGTELYVKQITDINGSHLDGERAGQEAYNEAAKRLSSYIFTEIEEAMFK